MSHCIEYGEHKYDLKYTVAWSSSLPAWPGACGRAQFVGPAGARWSLLLACYYVVLVCTYVLQACRCGLTPLLKRKSVEGAAVVALAVG
jgi:hypothetical protein